MSPYNSIFFSDKLVVTSVTRSSTTPLIHTPRATSSLFRSYPAFLEHRLELEDPLLELGDLPAHHGQSSEHCRRLEPLFVVDGRVTGNECAIWNGVRDAALADGQRVLPDRDVPA